MTGAATVDDQVICPGCCHQFRAIPVDVQNELHALRDLTRATPELLAMLKTCHRQMSENLRGSPMVKLMSAESRQIVFAQMDRMGAVIAKAEGRTS